MTRLVNAMHRVHEQAKEFGRMIQQAPQHARDLWRASRERGRGHAQHWEQDRGYERER